MSRIYYTPYSDTVYVHLTFDTNGLLLNASEMLH